MLDTSRIVARGYALVQAGDHVLDSVDTIKEKDALTLVMRDGQVEVEVKHVERKEIWRKFSWFGSYCSKIGKWASALEEAISEFQKGMKLSKDLQETLDQAEKTLVKVMQADGSETELVWF